MTSGPPPPTEAVFRAALAGSAAAWEELYRHTRPQLFRFARTRLATDEQAEDAVSETFARAVGAADRYRPGVGVTAWLVGICRNVVHEAYRAGGRHRSIDPVELRNRPDTTDGTGPADGLLAREDAARVRLAFTRLSAEDQELLVLRVVVGLEAEEVASVVGKRAGAVRMAQSRALARLRTHLEEAT